VYGAIELGGTKVNVAVAGADGSIAARARIPTTEAAETLAAVRDFFLKKAGAAGISALGVGAFGPVVINPEDPLYGRLLPNPKPGWSGVDLLAGLAGVTQGPIALTTDVAAAGVAEAEQGALAAARIGVYVTIGTGIGAAVLVDRRPLPALLHPEMGHLRLRLRPEDPGRCICRFHDDCAEGLVAGPAVLARWGRPLNDFAPDGPEVALAADYVGQLMASIVLAVSPQRIVLGGGVAKAPGLLTRAASAMEAALNGYVAHGRSRPGFNYIVAPALGDDAGIAGALILAKEALRNTQKGCR
jgi:fructokinase